VIELDRALEMLGSSGCCRWVLSARRGRVAAFSLPACGPGAAAVAVGCRRTVCACVCACVCVWGGGGKLLLWPASPHLADRVGGDVQHLGQRLRRALPEGAGGQGGGAQQAAQHGEGEEHGGDLLATGLPTGQLRGQQEGSGGQVRRALGFAWRPQRGRGWGGGGGAGGLLEAVRLPTGFPPCGARAGAGAQAQAGRGVAAAAHGWAGPAGCSVQRGRAMRPAAAAPGMGVGVGVWVWCVVWVWVCGVWCVGVGVGVGAGECARACASR
jgi:hypothetical protein